MFRFKVIATEKPAVAVMSVEALKEVLISPTLGPSEKKWKLLGLMPPLLDAILAGKFSVTGMSAAQVSAQIKSCLEPVMPELTCLPVLDQVKLYSAMGRLFTTGTGPYDVCLPLARPVSEEVFCRTLNFEESSLKELIQQLTEKKGAADLVSIQQIGVLTSGFLTTEGKVLSRLKLASETMEGFQNDLSFGRLMMAAAFAVQIQTGLHGFLDRMARIPGVIPTSEMAMRYNAYVRDTLHTTEMWQILILLKLSIQLDVAAKGTSHSFSEFYCSTTGALLHYRDQQDQAVAAIRKGLESRLLAFDEFIEDGSGYLVDSKEKYPFLPLSFFNALERWMYGSGSTRGRMMLLRQLCEEAVSQSGVALFCDASVRIFGWAREIKLSLTVQPEPQPVRERDKDYNELLRLFKTLPQPGYDYEQLLSRIDAMKATLFLPADSGPDNELVRSGEAVLRDLRLKELDHQRLKVEEMIRFEAERSARSQRLDALDTTLSCCKSDNDWLAVLCRQEQQTRAVTEKHRLAVEKRKADNLARRTQHIEAWKSRVETQTRAAAHYLAALQELTHTVRQHLDEPERYSTEELAHSGGVLERILQAPYVNQAASQEELRQVVATLTENKRALDTLLAERFRFKKELSGHFGLMGDRKNNRQWLLTNLTHPMLKAYIEELYRPTAKKWDGGSAAALMFEAQVPTAKWLSPHSHYFKCCEFLEELLSFRDAFDECLPATELEVLDCLIRDLEAAVAVFRKSSHFR